MFEAPYKRNCLWKTYVFFYDMNYSYCPISKLWQDEYHMVTGIILSDVLPWISTNSESGRDLILGRRCIQH